MAYGGVSGERHETATSAALFASRAGGVAPRWRICWQQASANIPGALAAQASGSKGRKTKRENRRKEHHCIAVHINRRQQARGIRAGARCIESGTRLLHCFNYNGALAAARRARTAPSAWLPPASACLFTGVVVWVSLRFFGEDGAMALAPPALFVP